MTDTHPAPSPLAPWLDMLRGEAIALRQETPHRKPDATAALAIETAVSAIERESARGAIETYRWSITVRRLNTYGDRIEETTPAVIIAPNRDDVTRQVRQMFGAKYDDFRKFWSHDWTLQSVEAGR